MFSREGYQQQTVTLLHVISGAVCGNILLGGLIGWGVDACTGAQYKLVPENVHLELQKSSGTEPTTIVPKTLTTEDKINQLKNMLDKGMLTKEEYEAKVAEAEAAGRYTCPCGFVYYKTVDSCPRCGLGREEG